MFARWHRARQGALTSRPFWREMRPLRQRVQGQLRPESDGQNIVDDITAARATSLHGVSAPSLLRPCQFRPNGYTGTINKITS